MPIAVTAVTAAVAFRVPFAAVAIVVVPIVMLATISLPVVVTAVAPPVAFRVPFAAIAVVS